MATNNHGGRLLLKRYAFKGYWILIAIYSCIGIYFVWNQYEIWQSNDLTQYLASGAQDGYFLFYALTRILGPYIISFIFSLLLIFLLPFFNRRYQEKFFEKEEIYIGALAVFLVGYPGLLIYLVALILGLLAWHLFEGPKKTKNQRLSFYNLWATTGIFVLFIIEYWIADTQMWLLLKI